MDLDMNTMGRKRKLRKGAESRSDFKFYKVLAIGCFIAVLTVAAGIAAMASKDLRHEVAFKTPVEEDLDQAEPMPRDARPAKTREEAKKIIAQGSGSNSQFIYDPYGRLAKIVDPGNTVRQFVWSDDLLCEERDASGNVTKQFFGWGEIINGTKYIYTRDHLGSVREMTDSGGNVIAEYSYDPYGNVTKLQGSGPDSDFLYAGYFYHKPSGLYITAHRVYSPKLGRWISRDPIGERGGVNQYAYVLNSPVQWSDQTGLTVTPRLCNPGPCGPVDQSDFCICERGCRLQIGDFVSDMFDNCMRVCLWRRHQDAPPSYPPPPGYIQPPTAPTQDQLPWYQRTLSPV